MITSAATCLRLTHVPELTNGATESCCQNITFVVPLANLAKNTNLYVGSRKSYYSYLPNTKTSLFQMPSVISGLFNRTMMSVP